MSAELLDLPSLSTPSRVLGSTTLEPGARLRLADLEGPGCIRRLAVTTVREPAPEHHRQIILRMFWDGSDRPAVEAPLGDFFGLLHGVGYHADLVGGTRGHFLHRMRDLICGFSRLLRYILQTAAGGIHHLSRASHVAQETVQIFPHFEIGHGHLADLVI